jgi:sec-independent protein translocase protein TatC
MTGDPSGDPFAHTRMSLGDHLDELRKRLIRGLVAVGLAFAVGWAFYQPLSNVVLQPMHWALARIDRNQVEKYEELLAEKPDLPRSTYFESDEAGDTRLRPEYTVNQKMVATGATEGFLFGLKVALYFALAVGSPVLLWEMWRFIAAGLYRHERHVVARTIPLSLLLFVAGALFGYFVMVPYGLYFLATAFPPEELQFLPRLSEYLSLLSLLTLALGLVFQLPLVMYVLVKVDLVQRETFRNYRRYFIVGAFILAAILTPPDPFTQILLAGPMIVLFELGLLWTRFIRKPPGPLETEAS